VDSRIYRRRDSVVRREVAGEAFLVPIHGHLADLQELFVLNEVGDWLWERLDGKRSLDDLAAALGAEFEVSEEQALKDAESFAHRLVEAGLAEEGQTSPV
jgi:hypothetical protein